MLPFINRFPEKPLMYNVVWKTAIYDQKLRSRFDWLREPDVDAVATPPMFMAFDLLHQDGR